MIPSPAIELGTFDTTLDNDFYLADAVNVVQHLIGRWFGILICARSATKSSACRELRHTKLQISKGEPATHPLPIYQSGSTVEPMRVLPFRPD
jgi:hypothetical protein